MTLRDAMAWIDERYAAGAKEIGVSCNPIQLKIFVTADSERRKFKCPSQRETRIIKDVLHNYIAQLPNRAKDTR